MVRETKSHERFRQFLVDNNYNFNDDESCFCEVKKLDFWLFPQVGPDVLIEVKGLQEGEFWKELRKYNQRVASRSAFRAYGQMRGAIQKGRRQLKEYRGYPNPRLVVVIREEGFQHLDQFSLQEVLLGDAVWSVTINNRKPKRSPTVHGLVAGEHGALIKDGKFDYPYLSAICFLMGGVSEDTLHIYHNPIASVPLSEQALPSKTQHYTIKDGCYSLQTSGV